ncbi:MULTISPECIES: hypothetical protein [unclassified Pseudomonas]|jgi:hypothetical protein|nr:MULTISPECIES: hypothetical protein [unclassified Pseudomonas]MEC4169226.1 hypothetical protein [Pseudomonas sp. MS-1(2024)]MEC4238198.1 hypothetical protein [Pseudomonas sp. DSV-1]
MGFTGKKNRRNDNAAHPVEKPGFSGKGTKKEQKAQDRRVDLATF